MPNPERVAFIGAGAMAEALLRGLVASQQGPTPPAAVFCASDPSAERRAAVAALGIEVADSNVHAVTGASTVVLCVKPQIIDRALAEIATALAPDALVLSVAAGVTTARIEKALQPGARVIRTMPNTAAFVAAAATALSRGANANEADMEKAKRMFSSVGTVAVVEESLLDAVTGLSGSGPAYVMLIIEALADGGVRVGLDRRTSLMLAAQTVYGSAKLLIESGAHPGQLKDQVTSPGGTAIAGLHTLESGGLRRTLMDAVQAATARARELGGGDPR